MTIAGKLFGTKGPAGPVTANRAEGRTPDCGPWYGRQMARSYAERTSRGGRAIVRAFAEPLGFDLALAA